MPTTARDEREALGALEGTHRVRWVCPLLLRGLVLVHVPAGTLLWSGAGVPGIAPVLIAIVALTGIPLVLLLPPLLHQIGHRVEVHRRGAVRWRWGGSCVLRDVEVESVSWVCRPVRVFGLECGHRFDFRVRGGGRRWTWRGWLGGQDVLESYAARLVARRADVLEARLIQGERLNLEGGRWQLDGRGLRRVGDGAEWLWPELDLAGTADFLDLRAPDGTGLLRLHDRHANGTALRELVVRQWGRLQPRTSREPSLC